MHYHKGTLSPTWFAVRATLSLEDNSFNGAYNLINRWYSTPLAKNTFRVCTCDVALTASPPTIPCLIERISCKLPLPPRTNTRIMFRYSFANTLLFMPCVVYLSSSYDLV